MRLAIERDAIKVQDIKLPKLCKNIVKFSKIICFMNRRCIQDPVKVIFAK